MLLSCTACPVSLTAVCIVLAAILTRAVVEVYRPSAGLFW